METYNAIREAIALYRQSFEAADKAAKVLSGGPSYFHLDKLDGYVTALFNRFAPFKEGDRVEITKDLEIPKTSHWWGSRHFLIPGAMGTANLVDYYDSQFLADVVFDDESWIDMKGVIQPAQNLPTYRISERFLRKVGL